MADNPNLRFQSVPGNLIGPYPFALERVTDLHMVFKADPAALQETANSWLNEPLGFKNRYKVMNPYVLVTYTNASCFDMKCPQNSWHKKTCANLRCSKAWLLDEDRNRIAYIKFNLLTFTIFPDHPGVKRYSIIPFSFVDDGTALVVFRQRYGINMTLGSFQLPDGPFSFESPKSIDCFANMDQLTSANIFRDTPLHMVSLQPTASDDEPTRWSSIREAQTGILSNLRKRTKDTTGRQNHARAPAQHCHTDHEAPAIHYPQTIPGAPGRRGCLLQGDHGEQAPHGQVL